MTDSLSAGANDVRGDAERALREAIGHELREARKRKGWSRKHLVGPWGPTAHTLMFYELGRWEIPSLRFADLCLRLDQDPSEVLRRALQRAGVGVDKVTLEVDLLALLHEETDPLFLHLWAKNRLADSEHVRGVVQLPPKEVQQLGGSFHSHAKVAGYLAQFRPTDTTQD